MRKVFVKELSVYDSSSLAGEFDITVSRAAECIEQLTTRGVIKLVNSDIPKDYDIAHPDFRKGLYQFAYVGLSIFEDLVIIVFPKYLDVDTLSESVIRQVFRVIRKAAGGYSQIAAVSEFGSKSNDRVSLMLYLIELYEEYGLYENEVRELRQNGSGQISWDRTIARHTPYVKNGTPVYFDYQTIESVHDKSNLITELHRCILTQCYQFMKDCGLGELLAIDDIDLTGSALDDFGDSGYLMYTLESELDVQFVTWKQDVLRLMLRYLNEDDLLVRSDEVICLGTSSFYHIWELACKTALSDKVSDKIRLLPVTLSEKWKDEKSKTLQEIIANPYWKPADCDKKIALQGTLIPDIVSVFHHGEKTLFGIFDAKYYRPFFSSQRVEGLPGIGDITKQYLYQSAYGDFIRDNGFSSVQNAFLMPYAGDGIEYAGSLGFPLLDKQNQPFKPNIDVFFLPASVVFDCYLDGHPLGNADMNNLFRVQG